MEELFEKIEDKQNKLNYLSKDHELLRYLVYQEDKFKINTDQTIMEEFFARFGKGFPSIFELKEKITSQEYQERFNSTVLRNYLNALEQAIETEISR